MPTRTKPQKPVSLYHKDTPIFQPGTTIDAHEPKFSNTEAGFFGNTYARAKGKPRGMLHPELTKKKTKIRNKVLKRAADSSGVVPAIRAQSGRIATGRPGMTHGDVFEMMGKDAAYVEEFDGFRHTRSGKYFTRAESGAAGLGDETYTIAWRQAKKDNPFTDTRRPGDKPEKIRLQRKNTEKAFSTINKKMADPSTKGTMKQALIRRRGVIKNLSRKAGLLGAVMNTGQAFSAAKDASKETTPAGRLWSFSEKFLGLPEEARRRYGPPKKRDLNI
jgi:hypothetical protein